MAELGGSSQAVLEGRLQISGSTRLSVAGSNRLSVTRSGLMIRAQQSTAEPETSLRAVLGLVASGSFVQAVLADAMPIKLAGTLNSDQPPNEHIPHSTTNSTNGCGEGERSSRGYHRCKGVDRDKKWPYVQNKLRSMVELLIYDVMTINNATPKEKKVPKDLIEKLRQSIACLDHAANIKSNSEAEKYHAQTVSTLNDVLSKLG